MKHKPDNIAEEDWNAVDSPPLTDEFLAQMRPVSETHPKYPARVRGLQKEPKKVPISIRLSPDVVHYFRAQGSGWQTKINNVLMDYVEEASASVSPTR